MINEEYIEILFDKAFIKTIIMRAIDGSIGDYRIDKIRIYEIPIPEINLGNPWNPLEVLKIINKLKDIKKDINWEVDTLGYHDIEAIRFMALLESIAGKRNFNKLAYLVFNEMCI